MEEIMSYGKDICSIMERVLIVSDLEKLTPAERVSYYMQTCKSLGLNPLTRPFDYIKLPGRGLILYARKDCTDQLRAKHRISIDPIKTQQLGDVYIVTVVARTMDGRTDSDMGVVPIKGLSANEIAIGIMKGITKAKRRVTLSIQGLGWTDESEWDVLPREEARKVKVDLDTGEILEEEPSPLSSPSSSNQDKMTSAQHRAIEALIGKAGLDREQIKAWMVAERMLVPGGYLTDLSKKMASSMIDRWDDVLHRYQDWALGQTGDSEAIHAREEER